MRYATTRNDRDALAPPETLRSSRAPDGGFCIPLESLHFTGKDLETLKTRSFHDILAEVLNRMFGSSLTRWDLEFALGKRPVRIEALGQRIVMGELWHNTGWQFHTLVRDTVDLISPQADIRGTVSDWAKIAVRIAVLFAMAGQLQRQGLLEPGQKMDVSVLTGDFSGAMSLWYARRWGLPVRNIICACNENSGLWELFHHGQLHTDAAAKPTATPEADVVVPAGLERLIHACGGAWEVERFVEICRRGGVYTPEELTLERMRQGLYVNVVSQRRMNETIPTAYATHGYLLNPYTAIAYAGLLDYRAATGESHSGLILADRSPDCDLAAVAKALGVPEQRLKDRKDNL